MRDLLYVGTVILLVPVILYRPWIGILAWTLLGLLNPQSLTYQFQNFPFAVIIGGTTLVGLLVTQGRRGIPVTTQTVLLGLLVLWFTITTTTAWVGPIAWDQWSKVMKIYLMIFVTVMLVYGKVRTRILLLTIIAGLTAYGIKGALFTVATGGVYRVEGPGGYLTGNTYFGCALVMVLPLIDAAARDQKNPWMRNALWTAFWLVVFATVFTYSRGALLGLGAVLLLMFWRVKRKALVMALMVPALVIGTAFLPDQLVDRAETIRTYDADSSAMGRVQAWGVAWNVALTHPLGAGFEFDKGDNSQWLSHAFFSDPIVYNHALAAHSIYFQILGEHGFVGLILYMSLMISTVLALGRSRREAGAREETRWIINYARALQVAIAGYAVAGAFLSLAYFDLFYVFVAVAVIMQRECRSVLSVGADRKHLAMA